MQFTRTIILLCKICMMILNHSHSPYNYEMTSIIIMTCWAKLSFFIVFCLIHTIIQSPVILGHKTYVKGYILVQPHASSITSISDRAIKYMSFVLICNIFMNISSLCNISHIQSDKVCNTFIYIYIVWPSIIKITLYIKQYLKSYNTTY